MNRENPHDSWINPTGYKKVHFVKSDVQYRYDKYSKFVRVRRSKKGMCLNNPEQFHTTPTEQRVVGLTPILPTLGCNDGRYTNTQPRANNTGRYTNTQPRANNTGRYSSNNGQGYYRSGRNINNHERELGQEIIYQPKLPNMGNGRMYYKNNIHYSPSLTINIDPGAMNCPYSGYGCQQKTSFSTISINPSAQSEEVPCTAQSVLPSGLLCCNNQINCQYRQSEQKVVESNELKIAKDIDERYVYVTVPPKISPLKSCWKWLSCKKKKTKGEVYLPTLITQNATGGEIDVNNTKVTTFKEMTDQRKYQLQRNLSRLSTITESDMSLYQQSSDDFRFMQEPTAEKKKVGDHVKRGDYSCETKPIQNQRESFMSNKYAFSNYDQQNLYRWICQPTGQKMENGERRSHYLCYKE